MKKTLILILVSTSHLFAEPLSTSTKATFPEIPYYLKQLHETDLEGKRIELNKIIHDAAVSADLSDPKIVKKMEPIMEKVLRAADSGLDRPYLEGQSMWLMSAIQYFEREKLKKIIDIPVHDWMKDQSQSLKGEKISTFPEKILLHRGNTTKTIVESANIYEAVVSPNGSHVGFSRRTNDESRAEIWVVDLKNLKRKKIASFPSCHTLLFSIDGSRLFIQEETNGSTNDSALHAVSRNGGTPKLLGKIRLLETLVEKGPYKGNLIVYKNVLHHLGTTGQDCAHAIKTNGRESGRLKNGPCR